MAKELETASAQEELKLTQLQNAQEKLKQKGWPACRFALLYCAPRESIKLLVAGTQPSVSDILAIAGDTLGEVLDKREGHTVTDKNIYRYVKVLLHLGACFLAPGASSQPKSFVSALTLSSFWVLQLT